MTAAEYTGFDSVDIRMKQSVGEDCKNTAAGYKNSPPFGGEKLYMTEILSDNRRINGELLADADQVGILDVVPLSDLHVADTEALANAAEDIAGGHGVDNVVAVVYEASVGILPAAGHVLEFFVIDVVGHFGNLLYVICFCEINIAYGVSQKSHTSMFAPIYSTMVS